MKFSFDILFLSCLLEEIKSKKQKKINKILFLKLKLD